MRVDLILMDVKMPKRDGFEVVRELKGDPSTAKMPVILFTGSESYWMELLDRCIELGVNDWLRKPFRFEDLMEKIEKALGEGPGRRQAA